jgi:hypothetical protein
VGASASTSVNTYPAIPSETAAMVPAFLLSTPTDAQTSDLASTAGVTSTTTYPTTRTNTATATTTQVDPQNGASTTGSVAIAATLILVPTLFMFWL